MFSYLVLNLVRTDGKIQTHQRRSQDQGTVIYHTFISSVMVLSKDMLAYISIA